MIRYTLVRKSFASTLVLPLALLLACPGVSALAQQESSSSQQPPHQQQNASPQSQQTTQPQPPPRKQKKVWTNEDLESLRTPEDHYLMLKEAQEAAAAEAAEKQAAAEKLAKQSGVTIPLPATAEETQQAIKAREAFIADDQASLDRLNGELSQTPEERKVDMQKEIDRVTADLKKNQLELKLLQDHLLKLNKPPAAQTSPESQPPSSP